jgi:hypothetical protein
MLYIVEKEEYHRIEVGPLESRFKNSTNLELWNSVPLERERIRPNLRTGSGLNEPERGVGVGTGADTRTGRRFWSDM